MKKRLLAIALVSFCLFTSVTTFGRTDSTSKNDKGTFLVSGGVGAYSTDWIKGVNALQIRNGIAQPNFVYSGGVHYFVGRDLSVAIGGFYSAGSYNNTVTNPETMFGAPIIGDHSISKYTSRYKMYGVTTECELIYDRMYNTTRVLYCSAGIGYSWATGTTEQESNTYTSGNTTPSYSYTYQKGSTDKAKGHLTLAGIRGGQTICWYAELGYGYKGIVNAGMAVKL